MSMRSPLPLAASMLLAASAAFAAEMPSLGREATPAEIAAYDISADPNGDGLPPGSGTAKQGEAVYLAKCLACHGEKGVGGQADRLAGGQGTIAYAAEGKRPIKTVGSYWPFATSVFAYIRRTMPFQDTKSLTNDEIYAVTAYILQLNGIIGESDTMDRQTLAKVRMPNRDGFFQFEKPK